jgi:uncharacterized protein (TIGR02001 family)
MKKSLRALIATLAVTSLPGVALADLAFNAGVVSDYRYRGISQTRLKPAIQGGVDFTAGGFYLGAWGSSIRWIKDAGAGNAPVEIDLYGGYKGEIVKDLGFDVGVLTYQYPRNKFSPKAETTEIYGAITYGVGTIKYSHAVSDTFGNPKSKGSYYFDASAAVEVGPVTLTPHVGYQAIKGPNAVGSYTDFSLTVSKDFSGLVASVALVVTDANKGFYASPINGKSMGKPGVVLGAKYNF